MPSPYEVVTVEEVLNEENRYRFNRCRLLGYLRFHCNRHYLYSPDATTEGSLETRIRVTVDSVGAHGKRLLPAVSPQSVQLFGEVVYEPREEIDTTVENHFPKQADDVRIRTRVLQHIPPYLFDNMRKCVSAAARKSRK